MRTTIDAQKFKDIKYAIKHAPTKKQAALNQNVSVETVRKVSNAKTFLEYQANNTRPVVVPKPGTVVKPKAKKTKPVEIKDNRKWWEKLLNI